MSTTISGSVSLNVNITATVGAGGNVLTQYVVPIQPQLSLPYSTGTGPNQAMKTAQLAGTLAATLLDTDLTTIVCTDGSIGFANVRELIIYNDAATDGWTLQYGNDGSVSTPFVPTLGGTHPVVNIEAGGPFRICKPIGASGWACGTNKIVRINAGANTIPYRMVIVGN